MQPCSSELPSKTILVTGATGKQGRAFIKAVGVASASSYRILAVTRNVSGRSAKNLSSDRVKTVQGNLDDVESMRQIFRKATETSGSIWGVLCVLPFPGLGEDASREERQGINLANLSMEFQVKHFIYSSLERGGEIYDGKSKSNIERHIQLMEGLNWTIIRPSFFMENFTGIIGGITATVLRIGMKKDTKLQLIAADDIGHVVCSIFERAEQHVSAIISVVGDILTVKEWEEAYKRATGRSISQIPSFIGQILLRRNAHVQALIADIERVHQARSAEEDYYDRVLSQNRDLYSGMHSFEAWAKKRREDYASQRKWNNISVMDLVLGRR